ncbi:MAG: RNA chaperone Hfq [Methanothrix sp.]
MIMGSVDTALKNDDQVAANTIDPKVEKKSSAPPQFFPHLLERVVIIRMMDGRPIKGVLDSYNAYELLLDMGHGKKQIVFKGAISTIDYKDKPKKVKPAVQKW